MRVDVDKEKCTGCLLCEITCSLLHHGVVQREASAIQVRLGDLDQEFHQPVVCRQCKKMLCLKTEGKEFDEKLKKEFIWEDKNKRSEGCAFKALFLYHQNLIHCDLCQGEPECIKSCPTGALTLSSGGRSFP
jgi:anaerobic carbon-monoxide dehydrogenase iron sulfur subunit